MRSYDKIGPKLVSHNEAAASKFGNIDAISRFDWWSGFLGAAQTPSILPNTKEQ